MPYYKTIYSNAKSINSEKELTEFKENNKKSGIVEKYTNLLHQLLHHLPVNLRRFITNYAD